MELQRGVCSLCSENTRVLTSSDAEEFSKLLPEIYENFLTNSEFQKIKNSIKICAICCFKIQTVVERKKVIDGIDKNETEENENICHFCKTDKCLMKVSSNWKYFTDRTEGYVTSIDFPVCACPKCLFFFDVIYNFKTKLTYKFPQLAVQKKKSVETSQKQNDTPKRKSLSKSPPSSTKRKIFDNCFKYLQPLCNNNYRIDESLKEDTRLYKKIAYVNLKNSKDIDIKETPKQRPVIKIKLKPRHKRSEKELNKEKPFEKLSRSEEVSSRSGQNKSRKRRHSYIDKKESSEEPEDDTLQETPKAASTANLVPKRRVSVYIENAEKENEETKQEEKEETKEEINKEVENTPEETAVEEESNIQTEDETKPEENVDVHKNGIEEPNVENVETDVSPKTEDTEMANGEKSEETTEAKEQEENQKPVIEEKAAEELNLSESANDTPRKSPSKSGSSNEESDSDASDKDKNKDLSESDVLNGSERKKKRVTFSDEIIN